MLEYAYLNSYYQTGLKNLLDVAVLEHAEVHKELEVATRIPARSTRSRSTSSVVACPSWWPSTTNTT